MSLKTIFVLAALAVAAQASAQSTAGTLVIVPAFGEVTHANDEATAHFMIEEQDKDKTAASSRVNQKMKDGTAIIRKEDPQAKLKTFGYYTYPIYPEVRPLPDGTMPRQQPKPIGWRVGQYLEVKTTNLAGLPKTTAAAQKLLGLNGLNFGLSPATTKTLDDKRIAVTYKNLNERIASIAGAMGRNPSDAVLDTVDFEGSGNYADGQQRVEVSGSRMMKAQMADSAQVAEPSFEPGETTLQMRLVGKVKFK
ncbi:MAG: SIMPL domain-containing protein [Telluria sp.]